METAKTPGRQPSLGINVYFRSLRPHHWLKNALVFLPGLAGHVTLASAYAVAVLAFASFCLCASAAYVLNDLIDRASDREHPVKRLRPFAAGALPVSHGVVLLGLLLGLALGLGWLVTPVFAWVLLGYFLTTVAYSVLAKRLLVLDVVLLACLYGARVVAGGIVFGVPLSEWLVAFSAFLFLCLALVKRVADLADRSRAGSGDPPGRPYRLTDQPVLASLAAAYGAAAVVVLALYVSSPAVARLYAFPEVLWGGCLVLAYWLSRILILSHRAEIPEDPVAFAARDFNSLVCGALAVAIVIGASV